MSARLCSLAMLVGVLAACSSSPDGALPATVDAPTATAITPSSTTAGVPDAAVARWTEDMQALADGIRRIHPKPFWRMSETAFDASLAAAPERLAQMDDADATAEVMRLTAGIDGHTGVYLGEAGFHLYALHLYAFDDEIDVIAAKDPTLIGAAVLSIDGVAIDDAITAVTPYSPFDNASTVELVVPTLLATPEVLHAAGVVDDVVAPHYLVRLLDGSERTVEPASLTWDEYTANDPRPIGMTKIASVPSLARIDEPFWTTVFDGAGPNGDDVLYLQYNEVVREGPSGTIDQLANDIDATLTAGGVSRLIIDLRYNPGGNDRTYAHFLATLAANPVLARPGAFVVLIGRQTFSAAALFATELDKRTGAVFVGEPTGGGTNIYANPRPLQLPNSGIVVEVSSAYFEVSGPGAERDAVSPDVAVTATLDDLLAGRDPVLAAAIALG